MITFRDVSVRYRRTDVLNRVSFTIPPGTMTAVIGRSGAGKSTFVSLIAGMRRPSAGLVSIFGVDVASASDRDLAHLRSRVVAHASQAGNVLDSLSVADNIALGWEIPGSSRPANRVDVLRRLGLSPLVDRLPSELSGGQRHRVAVARTLLAPTPVAVFDEPTASVDRACATAIGNELRAQASSGRTVVVATHDPAVIRLADALVIVDGARTRLTTTTEAPAAESSEDGAEETR